VVEKLSQLNIHAIWLLPHHKHFLQPLGSTVFSAFKRHSTNSCPQRNQERIDKRPSKSEELKLVDSQSKWWSSGDRDCIQKRSRSWRVTCIQFFSVLWPSPKYASKSSFAFKATFASDPSHSILDRCPTDSLKCSHLISPT
jgi:hypothetical protein